MRKLIAWAFMYSLDGLLADEGTEYWQFCFGLPVDPADTKQKLGVYQSAYAHIMGRAAYEGMAGALPTADHPFSPIMNAERPNTRSGCPMMPARRQPTRWSVQPGVRARTRGVACRVSRLRRPLS